MNCEHKHTKYQPKDDDWKCPKCGIGNNDGKFYIEDSPNFDCELIHTEDLIICTNCGYSGDGLKVTKDMVKKSNLIQCTHCKGSGYIKK